MWLVGCVVGWFVVCGLWFVVCGLWFVVCGLWFVVCGLWFVVCGLWFVVCGLWFVVCGCKVPSFPCADVPPNRDLDSCISGESCMRRAVDGLVYRHDLPVSNNL